jgi:hypothetical protein
MADLARRLLPARGSRRQVLSFRLPGRAGAAMANGDLLPSGDCVRGTQTFDEWLDTLPLRSSGSAANAWCRISM